MDVAKLEKMKVVDLRNELQSRGLDTKGVKAVLVERLRAYVEGGAGDGGKFVCMRHLTARLFQCVCVWVSLCACGLLRPSHACVSVSVCVRLSVS